MEVTHTQMEYRGLPIQLIDPHIKEKKVVEEEDHCIN